MKQTIATTPEQSARLKACGVDPKTADMCWRKDIIFPNKQVLTIKEPYWDEDIPAWSLSALLSLLPKEINGHHLEMVHDEDGWYVGYYFDVYSKSFAPELIDSLYQLLCWTLERKPKTEEKCID